MKVKNNQELAHLWASQNVASASGSNFSFEGPLLYSYSTVIGNIIKTPLGVKIALLSEYRYSNTTAQHLALAARAMGGNIRVFYSNVLTGSAEKIIKGARESIAAKLKELPEKFNPTSQKSKNVYDDINQFISLMEMMGDNTLPRIYDDIAKQWRADFLMGVEIKQVAFDINKTLETVKGFNKAVDQGGFSDGVGYKKFADFVQDLINFKAKAESLGLKVPTGTATAIKAAKKNILISNERRYASELTDEVNRYKTKVSDFYKIKTPYFIKIKTLQHITAQETKINWMLQNKPTFVSPVPIIVPLITANDYLPANDLADYLKAKEVLKAEIESLIVKWRLCESPLTDLDFLNDIFLRVKGDTIETSHSAVVPLSVAKKLWRLVHVAIKKGADLVADFGESTRIGHYTLNEVRKDGSIKVGCHVINYGELELIAKQLGFIK